MRRPRRNHSPVFKAKVALAALEGAETLTQLAERFDVHAHQIAQWRSQLVARAAIAARQHIALSGILRARPPGRHVQPP